MLQLKTLDSAPVGDTIILSKDESSHALPGFKKIQPRVYSGFYPVDSNDYQESKKALDKLSLNDNSFTYEPESSQSLGHGFRCGFLGLLHMEIIRERVQREYNLEFLMTVPSVTYRIEDKKGAVYLILENQVISLMITRLNVIMNPLLLYL